MSMPLELLCVAIKVDLRRVVPPGAQRMYHQPGTSGPMRLERSAVADDSSGVKLQEEMFRSQVDRIERVVVGAPQISQREHPHKDFLEDNRGEVAP